MERYIFVRDYNEDYLFYNKGSILSVGDKSMIIEGEIRYCWPFENDIPDDMRPCLLKIDTDLFKTVFHSFGYVNWLTEYSSQKDADGAPLYPALVRGPETVIMYLMDLGVDSSTIMNLMYGQGNRYYEYLSLVQQFGKMV